MPICEARTFRGTPCKRYACKSGTMCFSHIVKEKSDKKSKNLKVKCLFKSCNKTPSVDTPNGKCCPGHKKMYSLERPEECLICMDPLQVGEVPLQCGHWMHKDCLMECKKLECPMCRASVRLPPLEYSRWKDKHQQAPVVPLVPAYFRDYIPQPPLAILNNYPFDLTSPFTNIPFEHIADLLPFEGDMLTVEDLHNSAMIIGAVYPELNYVTHPLYHVQQLLNNNGYILMY